MESKKIKVVLSTLYGTMGSSSGTRKEGNSIGSCKATVRKQCDSVYEMR